MHRAIPTLPQYDFMTWCSIKSTGTTLYSIKITFEYATARKREGNDVDGYQTVYTLTN